MDNGDNASGRCALVVCISKYNNMSVLKSPVKDQERAVETLSSLNFGVSLLLENHSDEEHQAKANLENMKECVKEFIQDVRRIHWKGRRPVAVFVASCHGRQNKSGCLELLPAEATSQDPGLDVDKEILQHLNKIPNAVCILILDACRINRDCTTFKGDEAATSCPSQADQGENIAEAQLKALPGGSTAQFYILYASDPGCAVPDLESGSLAVSAIMDLLPYDQDVEMLVRQAARDANAKAQERRAARGASEIPGEVALAWSSCRPGTFIPVLGSRAWDQRGEGRDRGRDRERGRDSARDRETEEERERDRNGERERDSSGRDRDRDRERANSEPNATAIDTGRSSSSSDPLIGQSVGQPATSQTVHEQAIPGSKAAIEAAERVSDRNFSSFSVEHDARRPLALGSGPRDITALGDVSEPLLLRQGIEPGWRIYQWRWRAFAPCMIAAVGIATMVLLCTSFLASQAAPPATSSTTRTATTNTRARTTSTSTSPQPTTTTTLPKCTQEQLVKAGRKGFSERQEPMVRTRTRVAKGRIVHDATVTDILTSRQGEARHENSDRKAVATAKEVLFQQLLKYGDLPCPSDPCSCPW